MSSSSETRVWFDRQAQVHVVGCICLVGMNEWMISFVENPLQQRCTLVYAMKKQEKRETRIRHKEPQWPGSVLKFSYYIPSGTPRAGERSEVFRMTISMLQDSLVARFCVEIQLLYPCCRIIWVSFSSFALLAWHN